MKKLLLFIIMIFALSFSVNAWHCVDTDQVKPPKINGTYGFWGDNGLLGGTSSGYLDLNTPLPEGCTGTKVTSRGNYYYKNVTCNDRCDGYTLIEYYCGDRPNHPGETVMFWNFYENSEECGYEVPEFSALAGLVAVIGALGVFVFVRKK
ncbi:MAG: hypothetical protein KatS3mg002_1532 [Candidatus Woesearchaeota archaeon]|nr:MAG: hypothetical protein KatS3mg002_1532 [Candidatus Woesearchaeota archaeon]